MPMQALYSTARSLLCSLCAVPLPLFMIKLLQDTYLFSCSQELHGARRASCGGPLRQHTEPCSRPSRHPCCPCRRTYRPQGRYPPPPRNRSPAYFAGYVLHLRRTLSAPEVPAGPHHWWAAGKASLWPLQDQRCTVARRGEGIVAEGRASPVRFSRRYGRRRHTYTHRRMVKRVR